MNTRRDPPNRSGTALAIDSIVSSQPELGGPTIPEGGRGWFIAATSVWLQLFLSGFNVLYGIVIAYNVQQSAKHAIVRESNESDSSFGNRSVYMWDDTLMFVPVLYCTFWIIAEPWSKTIVDVLPHRPRFVSIVGCLFLSGGIALSYFDVGGATSNNYGGSGGGRRYLGPMAPGILAGIGASALTQQTNALLVRYFRRNLPKVLVAREISETLGRLLTPCAVLLATTLSASSLGGRDIDIGRGVLSLAGLCLASVVFLAAFYVNPAYGDRRRNSEVNRYELLLQDTDEELVYSSTMELDNVGTTDANTNNDARQGANDTDTTHNQNNNNLNSKNSRRSHLLASFSDVSLNHGGEYTRTSGRQNSDNIDQGPEPLYSNSQNSNLAPTPSCREHNTNNIINNSNTSLLRLLRQSAFYPSALLYAFDNLSRLLYWTLLPVCAAVNVLRDADNSGLKPIVEVVISAASGSLLGQLFLTMNCIISRTPNALRTLYYVMFCLIGSFAVYELSRPHHGQHLAFWTVSAVAGFCLTCQTYLIRSLITDYLVSATTDLLHNTADNTMLLLSGLTRNNSNSNSSNLLFSTITGIFIIVTTLMCNIRIVNVLVCLAVGQLSIGLIWLVRLVVFKFWLGK